MWLDLARYADTHGYEKDPKRSIWPYRDWVIDAFNQNMPFDEFTIEQIAGDMLPNATEEQKVASGFHRNTMFNTEGGVDPEQSRVATIVDRVNTTATVWLGSTLGCAQCHTHKYDPFTITEYYRMFAFLNNEDEPQMDVPSPAQKAREEKLQLDIARLEAELKKQTPELDAAQNEWEPKFTKVLIENSTAEASNTPPTIRKIIATPLAERTESDKIALSNYFRSNSPALKTVRDQLAEARKQQTALKGEIPTTLVMSERKEPRETHVIVRGNFMNLGDKVTPGVPAILPPLPPDAPANRLTLARWLVSPENPLTARVTMNRFWGQYFGHGIVETVEDFGTQGERPTHPELLDWLATEFVRQHWDMKAMHKLIVMSATYRQSSRTTPEMVERDPDNRLFERGPRFRVPAETVRDIALAASGLLSPKMGGPSVFPYQPDGIWTQIYSGDKWEISKGEDKYRRGLYTFWRRTSPYPAFMSFDAPSRELICTRRPRSNTPLQALTTLNDPAYVEASEALARRMMTETRGDAADRVTYGFRLCVARAPRKAEVERLLKLYQDELARYKGDGKASEQLSTTELGKPKEKIDLEELAAWTVVANVLLNLDETITKG